MFFLMCWNSNRTCLWVSNRTWDNYPPKLDHHVFGDSEGLSSGKCLQKTNWKDPPFSMGKPSISIRAIFQFVFLYVYQRVSHIPSGNQTKQFDCQGLFIDKPWKKPDKSFFYWLLTYIIVHYIYNMYMYIFICNIHISEPYA